MSVGAYDTDRALLPVLKRVHGEAARTLHVGTEGDILKKKVTDFPPANVIVAGPPDPPWSSMGARGSFDDPRHHVCFKVIDVIAHQAVQKKSLLLFVLENVASMDHKKKGEETRASDIIARKLRQALPNSWTISKWAVNTSNFGLPQSRQWLYFVGRDMRLYSGIPMYLPQFCKRAPMSELLGAGIDSAAAPDIYDTDDGYPLHYTKSMKDNVQDWKESCRFLCCLSTR